MCVYIYIYIHIQYPVNAISIQRNNPESPAMMTGDLTLDVNLWNLDNAHHKLKCHGDLYTLSQGFVWINIILFNQLAAFWVAYFRVVYSPATKVAPEATTSIITLLLLN